MLSHYAAGATAYSKVERLRGAGPQKTATIHIAIAIGVITKLITDHYTALALQKEGE